MIQVFTRMYFLDSSIPHPARLQMISSVYDYPRFEQKYIFSCCIVMSRYYMFFILTEFLDCCVCVGKHCLLSYRRQSLVSILITTPDKARFIQFNSVALISNRWIKIFLQKNIFYNKIVQRHLILTLSLPSPPSILKINWTFMQTGIWIRCTQDPT